MSAPPPNGAKGDDAAIQLIRDVESLRRSNPGDAWQALAAGFGTAARGASEARRGDLWRLRGHVLRSIRRLRPAVEAYRRADRWYGRAGDDRERGRCAIGLVDALMYMGRYAEAERAARRGRRSLAKAGDWAAQARLLNNEGNLFHRTDRPGRALESYARARTALKRAGDARGQGLVAGNVANCLSLLGRLTEARRLYRETKQSSLRAGFAMDALNAEYNLAYLEFLDQRHERALEDLDRVRGEARAAGVPGIAALSALDRAEILLRLGAHGEALAEAQEAARAFQEIGMGYERAKAETFAALAEFRLGRARRAHARLGRALESFVAEGNAVWIGETLVGLATLWWSGGRVESARPLLAAAARRFSWAADREREGCARALLVRAHLEAERPRAATRELLRAQALARGSRSARLRHLVGVAAADSARRRGDAAAARRHLTRAAAESERLAARILDEQWRASFWAEWGVPHQELAALEMGAGRIEAAFEALERGRGRALASPRHGRRRSLPAEVRSWAAAEQARDRDRSSRGAIAPFDAETAPPVPVRLRRMLDRVDATPSLKARDLARKLPEGCLLLDYFEHRGAVGAFAARGDDLAAGASLASRAELDRLAHDVLFELRRGAIERSRGHAPDALDEALAELASLVLWPLLGHDVPRTLALVPVGPLTRLPWAALPLPDGRRLGEATRIVVVPGLRLGLAAPPRRPSRGPGLVVASPAEGLENVGPEAASVAAALAPADRLEAATAEAFLAKAPEASWIHFAGHGFYRAGSSGVQLADRWVLADELEALPLSARWVSLSACQTARALVSPGEEWFGLSRSLLLAGARAVLAAQWDVDDAAASRFMAEVYRGLGRGASLGDAVSRAQSSAAQDRLHPVDWAGFVVLGGPAAVEEGA